jgi:hypothetical protein
MLPNTEPDFTMLVGIKMASHFEVNPNYLVLLPGFQNGRDIKAS